MEVFISYVANYNTKYRLPNYSEANYKLKKCSNHDKGMFLYIVAGTVIVNVKTLPDIEKSWILW